MLNGRDEAQAWGEFVDVGTGVIVKSKPVIHRMADILRRSKALVLIFVIVYFGFEHLQVSTCRPRI